MTTQSNNPTHGVTLERMLEELVAQYGWPELGRRINIRCFNHDPGIRSSLVFLRRTPWARTQVEALYVSMKTRPEPKPDADNRPRLFGRKPSA